jgi:hypothetical protein
MAAGTKTDFSCEASTLADLVAAIDEVVFRMDEILDGEDDRKRSMYATTRDLLLKEAKRVSRELEVGLGGREEGT